MSVAEVIEALEARPMPCGSAGLAVAGTEVVLRHSGALWLEAHRTLVVADLHFEKGSAFAARGQMLPPYDTRETLRRLESEIAALNPRTVIFLGDTLHDRKAGQRIAEDDAGRISEIARRLALVWVVGNHDPDGAQGLAGEVADEVRFETLTLRHEPQAGPQRGEAAGHLHPCARVLGAGASTRRRCFITDGERIILPAFGAYAGGLNVRDAAYAGLFARAPIAVALGPRKTHAVSWRRLGPD